MKDCVVYKPIQRVHPSKQLTNESVYVMKEFVVSGYDWVAPCVKASRKINSLKACKERSKEDDHIR